MQTISPDYQIELTLPRLFEFNSHAICLLFKADDLIAEDDLRLTLDFFNQQPRKITASERHKTPACQLVEDVYAKSSYALTAVINNSQLTHVVAKPFDVACQVHSLCYLIP